MSMIQISILAIIGVITAVILKKDKPEFGMLLIFMLSFLLLGWVLGIFEEVKEQFSIIETYYKGNQYFYKILFKIIGITYLCEFTSGICKDAGYQTIANQVEMVGKLLILMSGIPILLSVVEIIYNYQI